MKDAEHHISHPIFNTICQAADALQLECYVIGGYVRDKIMKRETNDIDIVVIGSGIKLAEKVASMLKTQVHVFKNFGTAMLKHDDIELEFVGARKESYHHSSRKPVVEDGTLDDDQKRRDFTINALAIGLDKKNYGILLDPFNGLEDIKNKIIRTPLEPEVTFSDDPLRMMRAIRFASQLKFTIENRSFNGICSQAKRIEIISYERIAEELNKIILSPTPSYGLKLLDESGLLPIIFPELVALKGIETIEKYGHKDNFYHTLQVLDNVSNGSNDLWLRWAALLHDIGKPATKKFTKGFGWSFHQHEIVGSRMAPAIFARFKLPLNEKLKYVRKLISLHLRPISLVEDYVTDSGIRRLLFDAGDDIDDLMLLCEADVTSKNPEKIKKYFKNFTKVREKLKEIEEKDKLRNWQPPITGEMIMQTFNIPPSREVGEIKQQICNAILDGKIGNNYEEAYQFMLTLYPKNRKVDNKLEP